ncbi:MAG: NIPSNAP family protein [Verrucomicrobia bacterium]|nr:NIPSNAP family protein [Verrucomicrobiota bacterium]MDA1067069.1 NIPSNAP family protein [Verrucomicrobiota bacterium]
MMNRRKFLAASAIAGAGSASLLHGKAHKASEQRFHELIRFEVLNNAKRGRLEKFLGDVVIPGLNKLGCSPIGVFRPKYGAHGEEVYMLVPHANIESFLTVWDKLVDTPEYQAAADTEMSDPLYDRMESSLMKAFSGMTEVEVPTAIVGHKDRIFEMRTYESHNRMKGIRKMEMFNKGGEIQIFRDTGLHPVFFGQTVAGPLMPNLVYMLAFTDMVQRDKHWQQFSSSPDWAELRKDTRYKDTVSTITDVILSASSISQI